MKSTHRIEQKTVVEGHAEAQFSARRRAIDDSFLDETIRLFQARTNRPLNKEDARQIVENMIGFFQILAEWDQQERAGIKTCSDLKSSAIDIGE